MYRLFAILALSLAFVSIANADEGRILKVLPEFLDKKGLPAQTPSLYDRDAYQAYLRLHADKRSAFRFAVQWKAHLPETEPLKLRVEIRGTAQTDMPKETTLEVAVHQHHSYSHWAYLSLNETDYKAFGEITAWRATLWDGDRMIAEQKSFLWQEGQALTSKAGDSKSDNTNGGR